jgi:hypothetical protein
MADLYLGGLSCRTCPSGSGVVVTVADGGVAGPLACCVVCGDRGASFSEADQALHGLSAEWDASAAAASSVEGVESFLARADPLFLHTVAGGGAGAGAGGKAHRKPPMRLHPCHAVVLAALTKLAALCLSCACEKTPPRQQRQQAAAKAVACFRRTERILAAVLPPTHSELLQTQERLLDALRLSSSLSGAGSGAGAGAGQREIAELEARCRKTRVLAYGP